MTEYKDQHGNALPDDLAANNVDSETYTVTLSYKQYLKKLAETREHEWMQMEERCANRRSFSERQLLAMSITCAGLIIVCTALLIAAVCIK